MYLFKLLRRLTCRKGKFHLHSTMYLFKRQFPVVLSFCCFIYIPPCIYLNNVTEQVKNEVNNIYIPPCIYLNSPDENTIYLIQGDLHSTMYLFKLTIQPVRIPALQIYIPPCIYLNGQGDFTV